MNFTILTPNDSPVMDSKSDITHGNFGGNREFSQTSDIKDYTKRTGQAPDKKENPVDTTTRDIDDMTDPYARKREFSYQDDLSDVQKGNEAGVFTKSDTDNIPREGEGSDAVQKPEASDVKRHRKPNQWWFGTENVYEGEVH